jgi:probable F420-dependent oxidoreductase
MKFFVSTAFTNADEFLGIVRTADEAGLDGVAFSDHVFYPRQLESKYPYSPDGTPHWNAEQSWLDPWIAMGAACAMSPRLELLTNVFILPNRNPFLVAKALGTLAVLSNNRARFGVGVGWMKEEFVHLGQNFHDRGRRMDEMIEVMRALWQGGMVSYHGRFYDFDDMQMSPAPTAPVPIYVGGYSDAAMRRAATTGDGWVTIRHPIERNRELVESMNRLRAEVGREHEPFEYVMAGPTLDVDEYKQMEELGATVIQTQPWNFYGPPPHSYETKREGLLRFADDVLARLR